MISSDGLNAKNISERTARGTNISKKITEMIKYVPGGKFHFAIAHIANIFN